MCDSKGFIKTNRLSRSLSGFICERCFQRKLRWQRETTVHSRCHNSSGYLDLLTITYCCLLILYDALVPFTLILRVTRYGNWRRRSEGKRSARFRPRVMTADRTKKRYAVAYPARQYSKMPTFLRTRMIRRPIVISKNNTRTVEPDMEERSHSNTVSHHSGLILNTLRYASNSECIGRVRP